MDVLTFQLNKLKYKHNFDLKYNLKSKNYVEKKKVSFLFTQEKAEKLDLNIIYQIAISGLDELIELDIKLNQFRYTLFDPIKASSIFWVREKQNKHVLKQLDIQIDLCLKRLCPFFLLQSTHKILEYLIRKFKINVYNINSCMALALPYVESKTAGHLFQILSFNSNRWTPLIKETSELRLPLTFNTLLRASINDNSILTFINEWTIQASKLQEHSGRFKVVFGLYVTITIKLLSKLVYVGKLESYLFLICSTLKKALKSWDNYDFQTAGYMIVVELCHVIPKSLNSKVLKILLVSHFKKCKTENLLEKQLFKTIWSFSYLLTYQRIEKLPMEILKILINLRTKICCIIPSIDSYIQRQTILKLIITSYLYESKAKILLFSILDICQESLIFDVCNIIFSKKIQYKFLKQIKSLILVIHDKHQNAFDRSLIFFLQTVSKYQKEVFLKRFSNILKGTRNEIIHFGKKNRGPLILALNHPSKFIREATLKIIQIKLNSDNFDPMKILYHLISTIEDPETEVVYTFLGLSNFWNWCSWKKCLNPLISCLRFHKNNLKISLKCLEILKNILPEKNTSIDFQVGMEILNFCFNMEPNILINRKIIKIVSRYNLIWKFKVSNDYFYLKLIEVSSKKIESNHQGGSYFEKFSISRKKLFLEAMIHSMEKGIFVWEKISPLLKKIENVKIWKLVKISSKSIYTLMTDPKPFYYYVFLEVLLEQLVKIVKIDKFFHTCSNTHYTLLYKIYKLGIRNSETIVFLVLNMLSEKIFLFLSTFFLLETEIFVIVGTLQIIEILMSVYDLKKISTLYPFLLSLLQHKNIRVRIETINVLKLVSNFKKIANFKQMKTIWINLSEFQEELQMDEYTIYNLVSYFKNDLLSCLTWVPIRAKIQILQLFQTTNLIQYLDRCIPIFKELFKNGINYIFPCLTTCSRLFIETKMQNPFKFSFLELYLETLNTVGYTLYTKTKTNFKLFFLKKINNEQAYRIFDLLSKLWYFQTNNPRVNLFFFNFFHEINFFIPLTDLNSVFSTKKYISIKEKYVLFCSRILLAINLLQDCITNFSNLQILIIPLFNILDSINNAFLEEVSNESFNFESYRKLVINILTNVLNEIMKQKKYNLIFWPDNHFLPLITSIKFIRWEESKTLSASLRLLVTLCRFCSKNIYFNIITLLNLISEKKILLLKKQNISMFQQVLLSILDSFRKIEKIYQNFSVTIWNALKGCTFIQKKQLFYVIITKLGSEKTLSKTIKILLARCSIKKKNQISSVEFCHELLLKFTTIQRIKTLLLIIESIYWGANLKSIPYLYKVKVKKIWCENVTNLFILQILSWINDNFFLTQALYIFLNLFLSINYMGKRIGTEYRDVSQIFDRCLLLLKIIIPNKKFSFVLLSLFKNSKIRVRVRMFSIAVEHVQGINFTQTVRQTFTQLLSTVVVILKKKKESYKVKFHAIRFLQTLIYHFDSGFTKKWLKFIPSLIPLFKIKRLQTALFNCIKIFIENLKQKLMPLLNFLVKSILNQSLKIIKDKLSGSSLISSMIGCLSSLVQHLWQFLTRYLLKIIKISTHSNLVQFSTKERELEHLNRELIHHISKISSRQLLPSIIKFYGSMSFNNTSVYAIFQLLGLSILNLRRFNVEKYKEKLFQFYMKAFDVRTEKILNNIDGVELSMIYSFLNLIMKLKKLELKKFCRRMIEWMGTPTSIYYYSRSKMFFQILYILLRKFRKVILPLISICLEFSITCLNEKIPLEKKIVSPPCLKKHNKDLSVIKKLMQLRQNYLIDTFTLIFILEEKNNLLNKTNFIYLIEPLLKQLDIGISLRRDEEFEIFVKQKLVPCLIAYSKIASLDVTLIKLNAALLRESRNEKILIRLSSIHILSRLFKNIGIRYLCCLPDVISVLDEFCIDKDERIEKYIHSLKRSIEELIGEKIEDYLK